MSVKPWSRLAHSSWGVNPGFCNMQQIGVFLLPLDRMLVHYRSLPCSLLRLVFTRDGVEVRVVIRSIERYDLVKIKPMESEAELTELEAELTESEAEH